MDVDCRETRWGLCLICPDCSFLVIKGTTRCSYCSKPSAWSENTVFKIRNKNLTFERVNRGVIKGGNKATICPCFFSIKGVITIYNVLVFARKGDDLTAECPCCYCKRG